MRLHNLLFVACCSIPQFTFASNDKRSDGYRSFSPEHLQNSLHSAPSEAGHTWDNKSCCFSERLRELNPGSEHLHVALLRPRGAPFDNATYSDVSKQSLFRRAMPTKEVESNMQVLRNDKFENDRNTKVAAKAKEKFKPGSTLQESLVGKSQNFKELMEKTSTREKRNQFMRWPKEEKQRYMLEIEGLRGEGRTELADKYEKVIDAWWTSFSKLYDSLFALHTAFEVKRPSKFSGGKGVGDDNRDAVANGTIKSGSGGKIAKTARNSLDRTKRRSFARGLTYYSEPGSALFVRTVSMAEVDANIELSQKLTLKFKQMVKDAKKMIDKHRKAGTLHQLEKTLELDGQAIDAIKKSEAKAMKQIEELRTQGRTMDADRYQTAVETEISWWAKTRDACEGPVLKYLAQKRAREEEAHAQTRKCRLSGRVDDDISNHALFRRVWSDEQVRGLIEHYDKAAKDWQRGSRDFAQAKVSAKGVILPLGHKKEELNWLIDNALKGPQGYEITRLYSLYKIQRNHDMERVREIRLAGRIGPAHDAEMAIKRSWGLFGTYIQHMRRIERQFRAANAGAQSTSTNTGYDRSAEGDGGTKSTTKTEAKKDFGGFKKGFLGRRYFPLSLAAAST